MDKTVLLAFIARAHRHTYAAPDEIGNMHLCKVPVLQGHTDHEYSEGDLKYHDSYAGTIWAPGREVVFYRGEPIWCMAYQGQHNSAYDDVFFQEQAFPFLKRALMSFDDNIPFRGPTEFCEDDFKYAFEMKGDYDYFKGQETLFYKGDRVFSQDIMGSLIK